MGPEMGSRGVNIVILKIPEGPEPNGAQILKIHIFSEFFLKKWSCAPVIFKADIRDTD